MSGASEIDSYNSVLLAGEESELLPPNLPFLQSLHVGMPKKLFVDGLQPLPDLINQSLSIDHGNLSFDHLIRPKKNRLRNRQADLLGGFQIDDQLEFCWLLHRQITRLPAFEDLVNVSGSATIQIGNACRVGHEPPGDDKFLLSIHPWQPVFCCQLDDSCLMSVEKPAAISDESVCTALSDGWECVFQLFKTSYL